MIKEIEHCEHQHSSVELVGNDRAIDGRLSELGKISLQLVQADQRETYELWKEMMQTHHYLRSSTLFGRQLKYLIVSSRFGCVGGMGFSSPAWSLEDRDRLIGWNDEDRSLFLNYVVCNSRFLILPWIKVKNLASHVLSMSLTRLSEDWEKRYGYKPALVETFIDRENYSGTCYKAANWLHVGTTKGRGRDDIDHRRSRSVKDIYVYELKKDFCRGLLPDRSTEDWIEREFQFAELPNQSRKKRLIQLARSFYAHPTENIPTACSGPDARAQIKGAYRFFDDDKIQMEDILVSHYKNTVLRSKEHSVVLAVQDSSSLNYATHKSAKGLGSLSTEKGPVGLMMHDTLAITPDGLPLGLLDVAIWARDPNEFGKKKERRNKPIEEKESVKWLNSFKAVENLSRQATQTVWVSVGDREADVYDLFELATVSHCELLVRSIQNRKTTDDQLLWDSLGQQESKGTMIVQLPKSGTRKAREAKLEIRFKKVDIVKTRSKQTTALWAILVIEVDVPKEEAPVSWKLLTTLVVNDFDQAREKVEWYTKRWGIEVFHRTLKSGCKVEDRHFGDAENIKRCLAIDLVIAWRIYYLTIQGRQTPDVGCESFLEDLEWKTLLHYKYQSPVPPEKPPMLKEAIAIIAELGGYVPRKECYPGTQVMWRGLMKLHHMAIMCSIFTQATYYSELKQLLELNGEADYG
ncbi:IS4 family transposase [bacterium]|nr:IS4 family transposase [bacterium]